MSDNEARSITQWEKANPKAAGRLRPRGRLAIGASGSLAIKFAKAPADL